MNRKLSVVRLISLIVASIGVIMLVVGLVMSLFAAGVNKGTDNVQMPEEYIEEFYSDDNIDNVDKFIEPEYHD